MRVKFHGLDSAGFDRWVATAKASGRTLDRAAYTALARPSENVPVMRFATVENGLYSAALHMCVAPGTPCLAETMRKDAHTPGQSMAQAMDLPHGAADSANRPPAPSLSQPITQPEKRREGKGGVSKGRYRRAPY